MQTEILNISEDESSEYLDSIYALNQKNTPEVGRPQEYFFDSGRILNLNIRMIHPLKY